MTPQAGVDWPLVSAKGKEEMQGAVQVDILMDSGY